MTDTYKPYRAVLLAIAGIASVVASLFGFMAGAWGGWGDSVTEFAFWFLPALSFPVFVASLKLRRVALLCSCLILLGTFIALFLEILRTRELDFSNSNPLSVAFDLMIGSVGIWIVLSIMPICLYFLGLLRPPQSEIAA